MRLVDMDNFIENLKLYLNKSFLGETSSQNSITLGELASLINDEPTAYDIDKVVEKLKSMELVVPFDESYIEYSDFYKAFTLIKESAIKIVKQGDVADDVCEWENKELYGYYTSCTEFRSRIAYKDAYWKHCPYCGKKIKVVE